LGTSGQIGDGFTYSPVIATLTSGLLRGQRVTSLSAGLTFTIAVNNGKVLTWGLNDKGQLGDTTTTSRKTPGLVVGIPPSSTIVSVEAGSSHAVAITSDGKVYTWGYNSRGQIGNNDAQFKDVKSAYLVTGLIAGEEIIEAAAGWQHTLVMTRAGKIFGFGENSHGELGDSSFKVRILPVQTGVGYFDSTHIAAIAAGKSHSLAIAVFGLIFSWGDNSNGQLGDNSNVPKCNPTYVDDPVFTDVIPIAISASDENSYTILNTGIPISWGGNFYGQLGANYTSQNNLVPTYTVGNVIEAGRFIFGGSLTAFMLNANGSAQAWGTNVYGQLGNQIKQTSPVTTPVKVINTYKDRTITYIAPGEQHTAFLYNATACYGYLSDDPFVCSGRGVCIAEDTCLCQPGFEFMDCSVVVCGGLNMSNPLVCNGRGFCMPNDTCTCDDMWTGQYCDEKTVGLLFGSGTEANGELGGAGGTIWKKSTALGIDKTLYSFVVAGESYSMAIGATVNNTREFVRSFGLNNRGQLGNTNQVNTNLGTPSTLSITLGNTSIVSIAAGYSAAGLVNNNVTAYSWGDNSAGQLGLNSATTAFLKPTIITALSGYSVCRISCGFQHCMALTRDWIVWAWGDNTYGKLGVGDTLATPTSLIPLRVLGVMTQVNSVAVSASYYNSMSLTVDGRIYSWGDNTKGQLGTGLNNTAELLPAPVTGLSNVMIIQMAAGKQFACALSANFVVYCWGDNSLGQLGQNNTIDSNVPKLVQGALSNIQITRISIGTSSGQHVLALSYNGVIYGWGNNAQGQLSDGTSGAGKYRSTPYKMSQGSGNFTERLAVGIAAGSYHSLALYNGTLCYNMLKDDPLVCSGNGTCVAQDQCVCRDGFSGDQCQYTSCYGIIATNSTVCGGPSHGSCPYLDTCICTTSYMGPQCQYPACFGKSQSDPTACNGKGNCTAPGICTCDSDHAGNQCQYYNCYGLAENHAKVCSGNGQCIGPHNCRCAGGYVGANCTNAQCNSKTFDRLTATTTIEQFPKPTSSLVVDTSQVCSGHGVCTAPYTCSCKTGYVDQYCYTPMCGGRNASDPLVCNSGKNGTCVAVNNCTCLTKINSQGWCEPLSCYNLTMTTTPKACNNDLNRGLCINFDQCLCNSGYGGPQCEQYMCGGIESGKNGTVCSGHGTCIDVNSCFCRLGYFGSNCEMITCFGVLSGETDTVCSGNGNCTAYNKCECNPQYSGTKCQYSDCFGVASNNASVCSGHGTCSGPDSCTCKHGYSGTMCEFPHCFGVNSTDPDVCNGHGSCIAADKCQCDIGQWTGLDCQVPLCYGVPATNNSVCNDYGDCLDPDHCLCIVTDRVGAQCEINVCFGYNATDPRVCSGLGNCSEPNVCNCIPGKFGYDCSNPICYGIRADNPSVCSSHGKCMSTDNCVCSTGWYDALCDVPTCFEVPATDPLTCFSRGQCTAPNTCLCTAPYTGMYCKSPQMVIDQLEPLIVEENYNISVIGSNFIETTGKIHCLFIRNGYGISRVPAILFSDTLLVCPVINVAGRDQESLYVQLIRYEGDVTDSDPSNANKNFTLYVPAVVVLPELSQENCNSGVVGSVGCLNYTISDNGRLEISSVLDARRAVQSTKKDIILNMQGYVEFTINAITGTEGSLLEFWFYDSETSPSMYATLDITGMLYLTSNMSSNTTVPTTVGTVCGFSFSTLYRMQILVERPRDGSTVGWMSNATLYRMPGFQRACTVIYKIPYFEPKPFFNHTYAMILSQSGESLTASSVSRSTKEAARVALSVNAMVLECQPIGCSVPLPTDPIPFFGGDGFPWWVLAIVGVVVGVIALLVIIIIIVLVVLKVRLGTKHLYINEEMEIYDNPEEEMGEFNIKDAEMDVELDDRVFDNIGTVATTKYPGYMK
jgi:alpha-tubulin suppressor-like RCC1 family protein